MPWFPCISSGVHHLLVLHACPFPSSSPAIVTWLSSLADRSGRGRRRAGEGPFGPRRQVRPLLRWLRFARCCSIWSASRSPPLVVCDCRLVFAAPPELAESHCNLAHPRLACEGTSRSWLATSTTTACAARSPPWPTPSSSRSTATRAASPPARPTSRVSTPGSFHLALPQSRPFPSCPLIRLRPRCIPPHGALSIRYRSHRTVLVSSASIHSARGGGGDAAQGLCGQLDAGQGPRRPGQRAID